jgi:hypothetical protein
MKSSASVDGRNFTGPYRTMSSAHGSGWPYRTASHLNR